MGRRADCHFGIGEDEVLEMNQLIFECQAGDGVEVMGSRDPALLDEAVGALGVIVVLCEFYNPLPVGFTLELMHERKLKLT
jgi:hypothetical protein